MKKVIIIDDSNAQLNILKTTFSNASWEVYDAQGAKNAYEMIFDLAPDLIITDAIMPVVGGFQLVKNIRENDIISKIPVIIYSVLPQQNAKFYLKESKHDYFLAKNNNLDELLKLAQIAVENSPVQEEYRLEILKSKLNFVPNIAQEQKNLKESLNLEEADFLIEKNEIQSAPIEEIIEIIQPDFNFEDLSRKFKEMYDFSYSDEKTFHNFFETTYEILNYDLFVINTFSYDKNSQTTFFDIKNFILSPILQTSICAKFNSKNYFLYKKYIPNLKTITNEEEFQTKIEFSFEYNEKIISQIIFYSKEKNKWNNYEKLDELKIIFEKFFKARYVNKFALINKKENQTNKYNNTKNDLNIFKNNETTQSQKNFYFGIIEILNYSDLIENIQQEDVDIYNLKLSDKLINLLDSDEQILKSEKDEYNILISAKDEKHAKYKFDYIANIIENAILEETAPEIIIRAIKCNQNGDFNIYDAQKTVKNALENIQGQEKVVIL